MSKKLIHSLNTLKVYGHIPVLMDEVIEFLKLKKGMTVVDATVGLGGHALRICEKIMPGGHLLAIDADERNLSVARERLNDNKISFYHGNFSDIKEAVEREMHFSVSGGRNRDGQDVGCCDAILFDLGLSSAHVDDAARGFSFRREGSLDMRFDQSQSLTAEKVVNKYSFENLVRIFRDYGQERFAAAIARRIVAKRKLGAIILTSQLVNLIAEVKRRPGRIHPATQVFQALRIEVNDELGRLNKALRDAIGLLRPDGRLAVISYHSLEDRIVKNVFREFARRCICPPEAMRCECDGEADFEILTRKPVVPREAEIEKNPRSRSAKLRVGERF